MFLSYSVPKIVTQYDACDDKSYSHLCQTFVRNALKRWIPKQSIYEEHVYSLKDQYVTLLSTFPIVKISSWGSAGFAGSISLLCKSQAGSGKFFYEMVSRWLLPGKLIKLESFISCNFSLPEIDHASYMLCEASFNLDNEYDFELMKKCFSSFEKEVRLGVSSIYQANRILEIKGLFSNEKTALIQERISSLIRRFPKGFDYDIFAQMQHFLISTQEEFKQMREPHYMFRIVCVFYLFHKSLKAVCEDDSQSRHILFKLSKTHLHLPLGVKNVLGVFVGMNFLKNHEVFEENHLIKSIKSKLPNVKPVVGSWFASLQKEEKIQIVYMEVEKDDGASFTLAELEVLRKTLSHDLKNNVEKLMPTLFMPRNEEEVMKYIITLSQELKYVRDIPQIIISFEEQTDSELTFTVILLRLLANGEEPSIYELYERSGSQFTFIEDRIKQVGWLRGKYPKEATVFRLVLPKIVFMREDHSVDLLKARQEVVKEVRKMVGEFRDYNGGMISKQNETLLSLKQLIGDYGKKNDLLVENFFHSIFPMENRTVIDPKVLYKFFQMFVEVHHRKQGEVGFLECQIQESQDVLLVMMRLSKFEEKSKVKEVEKKLRLPTSQLLSFVMNHSGVCYIGYIAYSLTEDTKKVFLEGLYLIQENSIFCSK